MSIETHEAGDTPPPTPPAKGAAAPPARPPPPPPAAGFQEVVGTGGSAKGKGKGKGSAMGKPPPTHRGGWFTKAQTLCELVLMDSPKAYFMAMDLYAGPKALGTP